METSSDNTDYISRSSTTDQRTSERNIMSPSSSSYLSWIESVNSEYFGSAVSSVPGAQDLDNKVGEWNNFWLNYSNARLHHLSTDQTFSSDGADKTAEENSEDRKSQGSTQRDITEKNSVECVMLTVDEFNEAMKCSQRVMDILNCAMKRNEMDDSSNESYYSQPLPIKNNPIESASGSSVLNRERSVSCVVDSQSLQKPKQMSKNTQQSSSTSCLNAILSTSVADILKKVITKKRDIIVSDVDGRTATRNSFSEWSGR
ncbi:uncharacterized protein LOC115889371 [Sitophilus oryzae]|uniref:Uncharacterized protein LOC115889371 n=1 Tax=Sitophilus oryzae TaxID=7048 RepID=A0A6J2YR03_SITOR|nr:uncharacterized protein LOC115889371 [Sitophilus oryzae]